MKIIASKDSLVGALQFAENIITAKTTMSILSNILLETVNNSLRIISTDLEVAIKILINADVKSNGAITLYAKKLTDIVKALPHDDIEMSVNDNNITTIKSKNKEVKAEFKIKGIPKNDYPVLPEIKKEYTFKIAQKNLKDMIRKTIFAVSTEDSRAAINGIKIELKDKKLRLVATDGRRLSFMDNKVDSDIKINDVIVPFKVLNELLKILKDEGMAEISLSENQIYFKVDDIELISRLIDGKFPEYMQVIPQSYEKKVVFFTNKMLNALKRVSLLTSEKRTGKIKFSFKKNSLEVSSSDPEIGEAREDIEIIYEDKEFEIAFSSEYLLDSINAIDSEKFVMGFNNSESASMLKEDGSENFFCLIMPIRIS
ncbi:MAG: DNA polymerase III subunit beta [Spirochaetes bacterium]|nr:DNA polymerase III subunit beta [Spirochaetota bacterium]